MTKTNQAVDPAIQLFDRVTCLPSDAQGDLLSPEKAYLGSHYDAPVLWPYITAGNGRGAWIVSEMFSNGGIYDFLPSNTKLALLNVRANPNVKRIVPCSKLIKLPQKYLLLGHYIEPAISKNRLGYLRKRIRPVLRLTYGTVDVWRGKLTYIVDPGGNKSLLWNPRPLEPADDLEELGDIYTNHPFASSVFFKPTSREVLSQIPQELADSVVAYEVDCDDNEPEHGGMSHTTITTLYNKSSERNGGAA